jgi:hypothetical protein
MKKIYIGIISTLIIISIIAFPGCGGNGGGNNVNNGNNGNSEPGAGIRFYEVKGGTAFMPDNLNAAGIVFADSLSEIGDEYIQFVGNNSESIVPTIQAFYKDVNGNIVNVPVSFAKDPTADDCFNMDSPSDIGGGGSQFQLIGNAPGGKGKLIASANGVTREIDVYIYNSYGVLGLTSGRIIDSNGNQSNSTTRSLCAFFQESDGAHIVGKSYFVDSCDGFTWKSKLKAIKTVNTSSIIGGNINTLLDGNEPKIYVAEVVGGGYMKIVRIGASEIWEYTNTTSFK